MSNNCSLKNQGHHFGDHCKECGSLNSNKQKEEEEEKIKQRETTYTKHYAENSTKKKKQFANFFKSKYICNEC